MTAVENWPSLETFRQWDVTASEHALVGVLLIWPALIAEVSKEITPEDMQEVWGRSVYLAMLALWQRGIEPYPPAVEDELASNGSFERVTGLDRSYLTTLQADSPSRSAVPGLVKVILDGCLRRRLALTAKTVHSLAADLTIEPSAAVDQAKEMLANLERLDGSPSEVEPLGKFCAGDDTYDWQVVNLIERGDRILIVAPEAAGKSVWMRQVGITCSFGIHPFVDHRFFDPLRVLLVDFENPPAMMRRKMRAALIQARKTRPQGDDSMMGVVCKPSGIDITKRSDSRWLASQIADAKPDLLLLGPLYKMFAPDDRHEVGARTVTTVIDDLRERFGFSLIMETHAPQEFGGKREMRPIGSSLWRRWTDIGLSFEPLREKPDTIHMRVWKPRDERHWPEFLKRGGAYAWTACRDPRKADQPIGKHVDTHQPEFDPGES